MWLYCVFILYFGGLNPQNFILDALKRSGCRGPRSGGIIEIFGQTEGFKFVAMRILT